MTDVINKVMWRSDQYLVWLRGVKTTAINKVGSLGDHLINVNSGITLENGKKKFLFDANCGNNGNQFCQVVVNALTFPVRMTTLVSGS